MPEGTRADLLKRYAALVRHWAPRLDLVSPGDLVRFEDRHVEDCLRLLPLVRARPPGPAIDVGSGAGLPGIPLAIADPQRHWRLLEPRAKRAAFLEEVVRDLDLDCEVLAVTARDAGRDPRLARKHVIATARALAPPEKAFELVLSLVAPGGIAAVFLGEGAELPAKAESWAPGIAKMTAPNP